MQKDKSKVLLILAIVVGIVFILIGLFMLIRVSRMSFNLTNLQPLVKFLTSLIFIILGLIIIGLSNSIYFKHTVIKRLNEIENNIQHREES